MGSTGEDRPTEIVMAHINCVSFTDDGKQVVTGDTEGRLRRWKVDRDGKREIGQVIQTGAQITAAVLSPNRRQLVCGLHSSKSNIVKVWDAETHEPRLDIKEHSDKVTSVDVSSDSTRLATGSDDKRACIWDLGKNKRLFKFTHKNPVVAVRFSPYGDRLAVAVVHASICIYNSTDGKQLLDIPCPFYPNLSLPLAWSTNGSQLFVASYNDVKHFKNFQGHYRLHGGWSEIPGGAFPSCMVLSRNQKFIAVAADKSLSFWDIATHKRIGSVFKYDGKVCSVVLSTQDDSVVTGEQKGKIVVRRLRDVLPDDYLPVITHIQDDRLQMPRLSFISVNNPTLDLWKRGNLARVEQLLTEQIQHPSDVSFTPHALAHRALVRCHSKQYVKAVDDAQRSIDHRPSPIGYLALAIARVSKGGKGELDSAIKALDSAYLTSPPAACNLPPSIKAILLFRHGEHREAMLVVDDLIRREHANSLQMVVKARMLFLLGKYEQAVSLLASVQAISTEPSPQLVEMSLILGWNFDGLAPAIQHKLQECITRCEAEGDTARESGNPSKAIQQYSIALCLKPSNTADLSIKRSKARAMLMQWDGALKDANEAVMADPENRRGYERKHAALHALQRYGEAVDALTYMVSLPERALDVEARQLTEDFALAQKEIDMAVRDVCPFVLVEVKPNSGSLCDQSKRMNIFKSEPQFKELVSFMTHKLDVDQIRRVVAEYFRYVTFSHVWDGTETEEPSYQHVKSVKSVWKLNPSRQNNKLRKFCEMVREDGYRWAWSDTCCIDKGDKDVLRESLIKMYKWYEESAATFAFLSDVNHPSMSRGLRDSKWMTRAWTSQELLAPKIIRFYDHNWKPYLGDTHPNHKESPAIMRELADAIGLRQGVIKTFNPNDLSVREKLRLASRREATRKEDIAYSLIGIFKSDIRPHYGEGDDALGHLLADVVARLDAVSVLDWAGKSSLYNSCLPTTLSVYTQIPDSPPIGNAEMARGVAALKHSLTQDVTPIYNQIIHLGSARFAHRRLQLPCIIFQVTWLYIVDSGAGQEYHYCAQVPGIGDVRFRTSDILPVEEPSKLIFVHPWICDLCDPPGDFTRALGDWIKAGSAVENEGVSSPLSPSRHPNRSATLDNYNRALRLLVRLQRPFRALLLEQRGHKEFRRVASEHEIVVPGLDPNIDFANDIYARVVDIL